MDKQQAIEEIIMLKKGNNPNPQMANQGNQMQQDTPQMNFNDYMANRGGNTPQSNFDADASMQEYLDMVKQSSDSYFNSQKAQIESMAQSQIAELERVYQQAITDGKMSVREAERQFEIQKQQVEKQAYLDSERTNAHAQSRGIQNSQQMVGLMQGDNARKNSLLNSNASDRDVRVNNIRDRINALSHQKDIDVVNVNKEKDYNILAAQSQADQLYAQNMSQFLNQNHFTQMGMQHDYNMADVNQKNNLENSFLNQLFNRENMQTQQKYNKENMGIQHGYDLDKMSIGQIYQQANMKYQNELDISKMFTGHKLDLEKMDKELKNTLVKMEKQFGFDSSLQGQAHRNAMAQMSASIKAQAKQADAEYEKAKQRQALSLGLSANATEYQIAQEAKRQNREDGLQSARDKRDAIIADSWATGFAQYEIKSIFNNPDSLLNPKQPKDYRKDGYFLDIPGNVINKLTGYDKKNKKAIEEEAKKKAALDAIEKKKREILGGESVQDKFNRISE